MGCVRWLCTAVRCQTCRKSGVKKSRFVQQHPAKVKCSTSKADMLVTCNSVCAIELYKLFLQWQMVRSAWKLWWRTQQPRCHGTSPPPSILTWCDDLTLGLSYNTLHQLYTVCVSIPQTKPSTAPSHQAGPRVKWLLSPPLVRFTTYERPWDTFLHFLSILPDRIWPLLGDAIFIILTGLEDDPCFTVSN